jgi:hypothetical protein
MSQRKDYFVTFYTTVADAKLFTTKAPEFLEKRRISETDFIQYCLLDIIIYDGKYFLPHKSTNDSITFHEAAFVLKLGY